MDKEVSHVFQLGIVLIALAVLIAISISIFKSVQRGSETVVYDLAEEEIATFDDELYYNYNNNTVSGNDVLNALYKYGNKDLAMLVATQTWVTKGVDSSGNVKKVDNGIVSIYYSKSGGSSNGVPINYICSSDASARMTHSTFKMSNLASITGLDGYQHGIVTVNYGGVLGNINANNDFVCSKKTANFNGKTYYVPILYFSGNDLIAGSGMIMSGDSSRVASNNLYENLALEDYIEYIQPGGRFASYLIRDTADSIIGVAFIEQNLDTNIQVVADAPKEITFTIELYGNKTTCMAIEGQTFSQWRQSGMVPNHTSGGGKLIDVHGSYIVDGVNGYNLRYEGKSVKNSEKIVAGRNYIIDAPEIINFKIDGTPYSAKNGTNFLDWVISDNNNGGFKIEYKNVRRVYEDGTIDEYEEAVVMAPNGREVDTKASDAIYKDWDYPYRKRDITFKIDGTTYDAKEDMTFEFWVRSAFNPKDPNNSSQKLFIEKQGEVINQSLKRAVVIKSGSTTSSLNSESIIDPEKTYVYDKPEIAFVLGGVNFKAKQDMTWREWVNTSYNQDGANIQTIVTEYGTEEKLFKNGVKYPMDVDSKIENNKKYKA